MCVCVVLCKRHILCEWKIFENSQERLKKLKKKKERDKTASERGKKNRLIRDKKKEKKNVPNSFINVLSLLRIPYVIRFRVKNNERISTENYEKMVPPPPVETRSYKFYTVKCRTTFWMRTTGHTGVVVTFITIAMVQLSRAGEPAQEVHFVAEMIKYSILRTTQYVHEYAYTNTYYTYTVTRPS